MKQVVRKGTTEVVKTSGAEVTGSFVILIDIDRRNRVGEDVIRGKAVQRVVTEGNETK